MNERSPVPDIAKGIAVIFMIQVHLTELFATTDFFSSFIGRLSLFFGGPPAAPVFMIIMGYFALKSNKNLIQMLIRGFSLILLGLFLNTLLNANALIHIAFFGLEINPLHLIFGVDILFLAGFSIVVIAFFKKTPLQYWFVYFFIAIIIALSSDLIPIPEYGGYKQFLMAFVFGNVFWSYFPLIPWLAYPLLGCAFALLENTSYYRNFNKRFSVVFYIVAFILLSATAFIAIPKIVSLPAYYHHGVFLFMWISIFVALWIMLIKKIASLKFLRIPLGYLSWTGKNVTLFYFIQWIIIGNIATILFRTQNAWMLLLWFAGVTIFCSLIVWLWKKFLNYKNRDVIL